MSVSLAGPSDEALALGGLVDALELRGFLQPRLELLEECHASNFLQGGRVQFGELGDVVGSDH